MALSILQHKYIGNPPTSLQFDSNVTQGSVIAVFITSNASISSTISDDAGNTYVAKSQEISPDNNRFSKWFYAYNVTGGTRITVTPSGPPGGDMNIIEIGGFLNKSDPFDKESINALTSSTPTLSSNITPTYANSIILSAVTMSLTTTSTASDNTIDNQTNVNFSLGSQYVIQTTPTAYNPSWTLGGSRSCAVNVIVFKPGVLSSGFFAATN